MSRASGPRAGSTSIAVSVAAGTNTLVAATAGKRVKVYSYAVVATGAGTVKFQDTDATALSGPMAFSANGGIACAPGDDPWITTEAGKGLAIVTSGAVEGHLSYVIEP